MGRREPGANLPAPYHSPWLALAEDLRAVAATLRLGLQELWRRNRQGDLPRPAAWPRELAPLFWPLLLALVLVALLLIGLGLARSPGDPAPPAAVEADPGPPRAERPAAESLEGESPGSWLPEAAPAQPTPPQPAPPPEPRPAPAPVAAEPPAPAGSPTETAAADGGPDPLAELIGGPAAAGLVRSARADPASASLELVLADRFGSLSSTDRQRYAQTWQQLAQNLGYEHLRLRDGSGALLAREAVVGGGMIVLSPPERS